jgi:hypothetical protein
MIENKDYFVVAGSFATLEEAQQRRVTVAAKLVGRDVNVYNPIQGSGPSLYSVVVAPNLPFDEAKRVLAEVSKAGFPSAYIWTFGVALRQWMPCVTTTVKERTWTLVTLQGIDHPITLALGNLYRVDRGPDKSRLDIIDSASAYSGPSKKFDDKSPEPPADVTTEFRFSGHNTRNKTFPPLTISGRVFDVRIVELNQGCLGPCQTAAVEICEDFAQ